MNALLYQVIANQVTAGAQTPEQKTDSLTQFVFTNMHEPDDAPIDGSPAEALIRGYAYCDSQSMIFMRLAQQVGLASRMVFLRKPDGESPHTLAEVETKHGWGLVDVFFGYVAMNADGTMATRQELVDRDDPIIDMTGSEPSWYQDATIYISFHPSGADELRWPAHSNLVH